MLVPLVVLVLLVLVLLVLLALLVLLVLLVLVARAVILVPLVLVLPVLLALLVALVLLTATTTTESPGKSAKRRYFSWYFPLVCDNTVWRGVGSIVNPLHAGRVLRHPGKQPLHAGPQLRYGGPAPQDPPLGGARCRAPRGIQ